MESEIEELESEIAEIDGQFLDPDTQKNSAKLNELTASRDTLKARLEEKYEVWETLNSEDN